MMNTTSGKTQESTSQKLGNKVDDDRSFKSQKKDNQLNKFKRLRKAKRKVFKRKN